jgi:hypothetical protein
MVFDTDNNVIQPASIVMSGANSLTIGFGTASVSGKAVVVAGGGTSGTSGTGGSGTGGGTDGTSGTSGTSGVSGSSGSSGTSGVATLTAEPASDQTGNGVTGTFTAGESLSFGDICYVKSDGKMWKADANASTTMPVVMMALGSISADASGSFLAFGIARNDAWNWTVGGALYASAATTGALTQTAPSGSGDQVQVVGIATHADRVFFRPDLTLVEVA